MLELAFEGKIELPDELFFEGAVPSRIERPEVVEHCLDRHPVWHLLVFRNIADALEVLTREMTALDPHYLRAAERRVKYVHQEFNERCFAGTVGAKQGVDGALRHREGDLVEGRRGTKPLGDILGSDHAVHR